MVMENSIITVLPEGGLNVPDYPELPFIEGDGTGPDIWQAARLVLDESVFQAFGGKRKIRWIEILAGEKAFKKTGAWLPDETVERIRRHRVAVKGPLTTPIGEGVRSINVALRQELDLYGCVRPVKYIDGIPSPMKNPWHVDMVVFRENTEDVYMGLEWEAGSSMARRVIDLVKELEGVDIRIDSGVGIKPISRFCTRRLVRMALRYALNTHRKSVTIVHKGNIMKYTEGAFRRWAYEVAREEFGDLTAAEDPAFDDTGGDPPEGKVVIKDRIADAMFQQILLRPQEYDVLAMPNLNGDYMSDALAAMVGGLGMAPGANIGDDIALFEATHGTAPKYAGKDKVNPGSLILSGAMMLDYMGWEKAAAIVRKSLKATVAQKRVTYDLARQMEGAREVSCSGFAEAMIENMKKV